MENEISAVLTEISAKRVDFFSYDNFSPLCRAEKAISAHARFYFYCFYFYFFFYKNKNKIKTNITWPNPQKKTGWKTPYDNKIKWARFTGLARQNGLIWTTPELKFLYRVISQARKF